MLTRDHPGKEYKTIGEDLFDIFENAILPHSSHIESLRLDSLFGGLVHLFAGSLPSTSWPALKKASLMWLRHAPGATEVPTYPIWRAPLLERLEWVSVDADIWATGIPWGSMKEVQVYQHSKAGSSQWNSFHPAAARAMVQLAAPNLRTLRLSLREKANDALSQIPLELQPVLTLPHLTTLKLTDVVADTSVVFLDGLQLPALKTLHYGLVTTETQLPSPDDHPLVRFLRAQHTPIGLTNFEIGIRSLSRRGLLVCLNLMPLLDRLEIKDRHSYGPWLGEMEHSAKGVSADKALLDALLPSVQRRRGSASAGVPQCLCPRLTTLRIDHIKCDLDDIEGFVDGRLAYSKVLSTPEAPVSRLKSMWMNVTSERLVTEGSDQDKRIRVQEAIKAKGVEPLFSFRAPSTEKPRLWTSYMTFDAFLGSYETERQGRVEEGLEDGWL